jgi:hypothetical protein
VIPPLQPLLQVVNALQTKGITAALGGSGLLHSLGLVDSVRDWDLTTDAPLEQVSAALGDIPWHMVRHGDQDYGTAYRINITPDGADIDLMGSFAVRTEAGLCRLPTLVSSVWNGVPVGSPEVWAVAYQLIGRPPKAQLLSDYLHRNGYRSEVKAVLLAEPLPETVLALIRRW